MVLGMYGVELAKARFDKMETCVDQLGGSVVPSQASQHLLSFIQERRLRSNNTCVTKYDYIKRRKGLDALVQELKTGVFSVTEC